MPFHRFTDPAYYPGSGGAFPGSVWGATYDRINVTSGGVGGGDGSAFANPQLTSGPNNGSYFLGYGDAGTSGNFNRAARALAENCDLLDDVVHRSLAVPTRTVDVAPVGQVNYILAAGTWVGDSVSTPLTDLFSVLDENGNEIVDNDQNPPLKVVVSGLVGAAVGDGFTTAVVTVNFNTPINNDMCTTFCIYYAERSTLATMGTDALMKIKVRAAEEVTAKVEEVIKLLKWDGTSPNAWDTTPSKNVYNIAYSGLDELYRLGTTRAAAVPSWWPTVRSLDNAGAGGWYTKDDAGFTGNSALAVDAHTGSMGRPEFMLGAIWGAQQDDAGDPDADDYRNAITSGFVYTGRTQTNQALSTDRPGLYGFGHFANRTAVAAATGTELTRLVSGAVFTITGGVLNCPAGNFFSTASGSAIQVGLDVICLRTFAMMGGYSYHNLIITEILTNTTATVRYADGATPPNTANMSLVGWFAPIFITTDNAVAYKYDIHVDAEVAKMQMGGMFFCSLPVADTSRVPLSAPPSFKLFARDELSTTPILEWGGHDKTTPPYGVEAIHGQLFADGGATFNGFATMSARASIAGTGSDSAPILTTHISSSTSLFTLLWEVYDSSAGVGSYFRMYKSQFSTLTTTNAKWNQTASRWVADDTAVPACMTTYHAAYGVERYFKMSTSTSWTASGWDDNDAPVSRGFKHLEFITGDTIDSNTSATWAPVHRSAGGTAGDLQIQFGSTMSYNAVQVTACIGCRNPTAGSGSAIEARVEIDVDGAGGWVVVPGTYREIPYNADAYDPYYLNLSGTYVIPYSGSGRHSNTRVRVVTQCSDGTIVYYPDCYLQATVFELSE